MITKHRLLIAIAAFVLVAAALVPIARSAPREAQARLDAAAKVYPAARAQYETGTGQLDVVYLWSARWFEADRAVRGNGPAAQAHLDRMKALESLVTIRVQSGMAPQTDILAAAYYRAEAELWVVSPPK